MAQSVRDLPKDIQDIMDVRLWDSRTRAGVMRCRELKARSLPAIALNGELVFQALIPGQEELKLRIEAAFRRSRSAEER